MTDTICIQKHKMRQLISELETVAQNLQELIDDLKGSLDTLYKLEDFRSGYSRSSHSHSE